MATPAGFEAAPPVTRTAGATAVPLGCLGVCDGAAGCCGWFWAAGVEVEVLLPGLSGSSTGGKGAFCTGA